MPQRLWGKVGSQVRVLVAAVTLVATVAGAWFGYQALQADDVPRFGSPPAKTARNLDSATTARQWLKFLDSHEGEKVYLNVWTSRAPDDELRHPRDRLRASGVELTNAPETEPIGGGLPGTVEFKYQMVRLVRDDQGNKPVYSLQYDSAFGWHMRGYFAVVGVVSARMGLKIRDLVPIDTADAVA